MEDINLEIIEVKDRTAPLIKQLLDRKSVV